MNVIIIYKNGSTKKVKTKDARTYENDPDYKTTVTMSSLLRNVDTGGFGGVMCLDIYGKNWFDLRDELLK